MTGSTSSHTHSRYSEVNRAETLNKTYPDNKKPHYREKSGSIIKDTGDNLKEIGIDVFGQLFGTNKYNEKQEQEYPSEKKRERVFKPTFGRETYTLYSWREQEERKEIQELKELIQMIKQEVDMIKKQDRALMSEVNDIEKITLQSLPQESSIYHVRFLEVILRVLKTLRAKIGESQTWLQALKSKKHKRGMAFKKRSQELGTQYMLSQEMSSSRSVQ